MKNTVSNICITYNQPDLRAVFWRILELTGNWKGDFSAFDIGIDQSQLKTRFSMLAGMDLCKLKDVWIIVSIDSVPILFGYKVSYEN